MKTDKDKIKDNVPVSVEIELGRHYQIVGDPGTFHGTPESIVFDMRFWDTGMGRVDNNKAYMKLVADRIGEGFPVCNSETIFLQTMYAWGFVKVNEAN